MYIRPATPKDLPELMDLFAQARRFMAEHGNPTQWAPTYPAEDLLTADMSAGHSYVCVEENRILASFFYAVMEDPTYRVITNGHWLNDEPYGVLHRIAVADHGKGVASFCINWCKQQAPNLRVDTHRDNYVMQHFLRKHGLAECGIIYLANGDERIAFQYASAK